MRSAVGLLRRQPHGRVRGRGPGALAALQRLTTNDVGAARGRARSSTRSSATRTAASSTTSPSIGSATERYMITVNAGNIDKDWAHVTERRRRRRRAGATSRRTPGSSRCRGRRPRRSSAASPTCDVTRDRLLPLRARQGRRASPTLISRTGYTGEDGFELYVARRRRPSGCGTRCWRRAAPTAWRRSASARATRCGSRCATRSTATTSTTRRIRSRPASAGSSSPPRASSSAARRIEQRARGRGPAAPAGRHRDGRRARWRVTAIRSSKDGARGRRGDVGLVRPVGRQLHRDGLRRRRRTPPSAPSSGVEIRGQVKRARVVKHAVPSVARSRKAEREEIMANVPADLRYTREHEWAKQDGDRVRVGITALRAGAARRRRLRRAAEGRRQGDGAARPSASSSRSRRCPICSRRSSGEVVEVNGELAQKPEIVNQDPYGTRLDDRGHAAEPERVGPAPHAAQYEQFIARGRPLMRYLAQHAQNEQQQMLGAIGAARSRTCSSRSRPRRGWRGRSALPPALAETDLVRHMRGAGRDATRTPTRTRASSAPALYDHYVPSPINHLILRGEFFTAYTPYQPEASQGTLRTIYEYQTMIAELTGMDVANASIYDGASSLAEAALMAALGHGPQRDRAGRAASIRSTGASPRPTCDGPGLQAARRARAGRASPTSTPRASVVGAQDGRAGRADAELLRLPRGRRRRGRDRARGRRPAGGRQPIR